MGFDATGKLWPTVGEIIKGGADPMLCKLREE